jgi:hypothetical protein
MSDEIVYLNTDDVMVTSTRLVVRAGPQPTLYAMRHVTSVGCIEIPPEEPKKPPDNRIRYGCFLLLLLPFTIASIQASIQLTAEGKGGGMAGLICFIIPSFIALAWLVRAILRPLRTPPIPPST